MILLSVIFLLFCTYGLGYSLSRDFQMERGEKLIIRIGLGLAALPLLGVILNLLLIRLD